MPSTDPVRSVPTTFGASIAPASPNTAMDARCAAPASSPAERQEPRVLLVEDNPADADLVLEFLTGPGAAGQTVQVRRVSRLAQALDTLATGPFDVVLLDLSLPDAERLDGLEAIAAARPDLPIVVMTGLADDRVALAAVHAGAQDYLVKGQDDGRLVRRAIRYAVERQELLARERAARLGAERASRARDEVLSIVSHDLRAPLSTITMCAHALHEPRADAAELAGTIMQSAEWSLRIIRDLLDVSAIEAGRLAIDPEPMTVAAIFEALDALHAPLARERGVELAIDASVGPRWVDVDVDRIVQALGNLVANAVKFTPRGGRVSVSAAAAGATVRLCVADTGPGISPAHLPHLFDRFWQAPGTRRGGAGLGLAIARGIAEGHGGHIEVTSTVGAGSTFTLVLPTPGARRPDARPRPSATAPAPGAAGRLP